MSGRNLSSERSRGQPIIMLAVLLVAWSGIRFATWATPFTEQVNHSPDASVLSAAANSTAASAPTAADEGVPEGFSLQNPVGADSLGDPSLWLAPSLPVAPSVPGWSDPEAAPSPSGPSAAGEEVSGDFVPVAPRMAAGHTLLMAAGFAHMELPPQIAAYLNQQGRLRNAPASNLAASGTAQASPFPVATLAPQRREARWSVDGWLLWREGSNSPLLSSRPSYGRSQLGAVVRYNIAPSSSHRPQAHLRGSSALEGRREREVAAGLSALPVSSVPLRLAAEVRVSERAGGSEVRPAVYAVTQFPPQQLPAGLQGEVYLQGGYVGGEFATAFVDGQARVDGSVVSSDSFDLRAGAAMWGGAQEDAERLDIGPSAALTFRVGEGRGRLAADYRIRVGGDAQPSSGPALTLSAGF